MFEKLRKFWASKVSITANISYPASLGVKTSTEEKIVDRSLIVNTYRKSDFRFVCDSKIEFNGNKREFFYTERFNGSRWEWCDESGSSDKDEALNLHLLVLERGSLKSESTKTVFWEGLSKEETQAWVNLQLTKKEEIENE